MIARYIIGGILLFLLLLLLVPVSVIFSYSDRLILAVRYAGIKVFDNRKQKPEKPQKKAEPGQNPKSKPQKKKKENFISKFFKEKGKIEGIKFCFKLIKAALSKTIWVVRKIKIRDFLLKIVVANEDAANCAVTYGTVCAAVYPVMNFLDRNTDFGIKKVDIYTDFDKLSPEIEVSFLLKTRLIFAVIAAVSLFFRYLQIKKESDKNG